MAKGNPHAADNLTDDDRSKGGSMSGGNFANDPQKASEAGQKGGQSQSAQNNPGNFANDPQKASEAGQKGGQSSKNDDADMLDEYEEMPS